jgi:hypothetical protein
MRMRLTIVTSREVIEFNDLPVIIGGNPVVDIPLDDPTLPPLQCMIERVPGGVAVWNLREDHPLYVNRKEVTRARLSNGDVLTIGQNRLVFSC